MKKPKNTYNDATTYLERFQQSLAFLCNGNQPPIEYCKMWIANETPDDGIDPLQEWACNNTAMPWAQGIGTIDAAIAWANSPIEGENHEYLDGRRFGPGEWQAWDGLSDEINYDVRLSRHDVVMNCRLIKGALHAADDSGRTWSPSQVLSVRESEHQNDANDESSNE